jgi:hypothetical protein
MTYIREESSEISKMTTPDKAINIVFYILLLTSLPFIIIASIPYWIMHKLDPKDTDDFINDNMGKL